MSDKPEVFTKFADEKLCVDMLIQSISLSDQQRASIQEKAKSYVEAIRKNRKDAGILQQFIQEYDLTTQEGLALMTLAEALLRVPDSLTANALIEDKLSEADWKAHIKTAEDIFVKLSTVGLSVSQSVMRSTVNKLGMPVIREATFRAMKILGGVFVLGQTIEQGLKRSKPNREKGYLYSFDMLGEAARTLPDAQYYYDAYMHAIQVIGKDVHKRTNEDTPVLNRDGISVKLSALYPRYDDAQRERCFPILKDSLLSLAKQAAHHGIALTMDAEEVDRLELSLDIFEAVFNDPALKNYGGLGLAIQAYQKRAPKVIDRLVDMAKAADKDLMIRLVKGAYWDTEIKHAQVLGMPDYAVFTRKCNTDLSYLACAEKLLAAREHGVRPLLGTHNAHTIATILEMAGDDKSSFAFQRLHGMAEQLYNMVYEESGVPVSIYGPVGPHADLLPYLVRRLLENGANSSFINQIYDAAIPIDSLTADPIDQAQEIENRRHPHIPLPLDIYKPDRSNSAGIDLTDKASVDALYKKMDKTAEKLPRKPADTKESEIDKAFDKAKNAFESWDTLGGEKRAEIIEKIGDLMEENIERLMAICAKEAGKTIPDGIAEVREAVEFCHYYAARGREHFSDFQELQGPTGEQNLYRLRGRGVCVCISPWNFPLAIFTGQVVAALMAGNCVLAKPAEQTPIIAQEAIELMHKAGVPKDVLIGLYGDGKLGAAMVDHPKTAIVAFTGSTEAAKAINMALAKKDGPITPLIAETGGQNAMIVDSTALPEQVCDDVLLSGFGSAGQRCSALRLLCLQDNTADKMLKMIMDAMDTYYAGDPYRLSTDVGPVIDKAALETLKKHKKRLEKEAKILKICPNMPDEGSAITERYPFFAPTLAEIDSLDFMKREVFGPIIHVYRYKARDREALMQKINEMGYGLTFGLHSRMARQSDIVAAAMRVGNIYVNRSMTGAIVGVQPFGGQGLSGTGPKAGGPNYLQRFATEQAISIDTTAAGGNTTLVSLKED